MERSCPHLSLEERRKIGNWHKAKMSVLEIADQLGRYVTITIYPEPTSMKIASIATHQTLVIPLIRY